MRKPVTSQKPSTKQLGSLAWLGIRTNRKQGADDTQSPHRGVKWISTNRAYWTSTTFNSKSVNYTMAWSYYSPSPPSITDESKLEQVIFGSSNTCGAVDINNMDGGVFGAGCDSKSSFVCDIPTFSFADDQCDQADCNGGSRKCVQILAKPICDDDFEKPKEKEKCIASGGYFGPQSKSCLILYDQQSTWSDAMNECNKGGGFLAEKSDSRFTQVFGHYNKPNAYQVWTNTYRGKDMYTVILEQTDNGNSDKCGLNDGETDCTDKKPFVCRYPDAFFYPCKNGGRFSWIGQSYKCDCKSGYTGHDCEIESPPTSNTPTSQHQSSSVSISVSISVITTPQTGTKSSPMASVNSPSVADSTTTTIAAISTPLKGGVDLLSQFCQSQSGQMMGNLCYAIRLLPSTFVSAMYDSISRGGSLGSLISTDFIKKMIVQTAGREISFLSNTTVELDAATKTLWVTPYQDQTKKFSMPISNNDGIELNVNGGSGKCSLLQIAGTNVDVTPKECNDNTFTALYAVEFSKVPEPTTNSPIPSNPGTSITGSPTAADGCPSGRFVNGLCYIYLGEITFDDAAEKCAANSQQIEPFLEPALLERALQTFNVAGSPEVGTGLKIEENGVPPDELKAAMVSCDGTGCATITLVNNGYDIHGKLCIEKHLYFCSGNVTPPVDLSQCATKARKCNPKHTKTCDPTTKKCICSDPWKGPTCDETLLYDYCTPNPCRFNAACTPSDEYGFVCQCMDGYSGKQCEIASSVSREPIQIYNNVIQSVGDVWVIGTSGATLLVHLAMYDGTPEGTLKRHQLHALLLEHAVIVLFRNPALCDLRAIHCRIASAVILYFRGAHSLLAFFHSLHIFYILSGATGEGAWKWWLFLSLGWGTPLISSGLLYFLQYDQLGTGFSCMLDWDTNVVYCLFALLPVAHLSMFKLAQARIGEKLRESRTGAVIELDDDHKQLRVAKIGRLGTMLVVVLAPLSYGFSSLAVFYADWIYYTVAFVVNSILGTSILVAYIVRNPYVRTLIKSKWQKRTRPDEATLYGQTREAWIE